MASNEDNRSKQKNEFFDDTSCRFLSFKKSYVYQNWKKDYANYKTKPVNY